MPSLCGCGCEEVKDGWEREDDLGGISAGCVEKERAVRA